MSIIPIKNERLYRIWYAMHRRCESKNYIEYKHYGKRGISVCKEWESFIPFCFWALSHGYKEPLTLDRINVNGNYEPSNCRWATFQIQANNQTTSRRLTYNNETNTIAEWGRKLNIDRHLISKRLSRGWSVEKALTTPNKKTVNQK